MIVADGIKPDGKLERPVIDGTDMLRPGVVIEGTDTLRGKLRVDKVGHKLTGIDNRLPV